MALQDWTESSPDLVPSRSVGKGIGKTCNDT